MLVHARIHGNTHMCTHGWDPSMSYKSLTAIQPSIMGFEDCGSSPTKSLSYFSIFIYIICPKSRPLASLSFIKIFRFFPLIPFFFFIKFIVHQLIGFLVFIVNFWYIFDPPFYMSFLWFFFKFFHEPRPSEIFH